MDPDKENKVIGASGLDESKPPEVKRLRTKLSTVRECLNGITNLIQNVPREAIDVTAMSDTTLSDENGKRSGTAKSQVFPRPMLPATSSGQRSSSGLQVGSNILNQRMTTLPKLPSSISIEIICNETPSTPECSSIRSSCPSSSSVGAFTGITSSIGSSCLTKSNFCTSTPLSSIGRQCVNTALQKTGTTFMQVHRGREGSVFVSGDFPRPQNPPINSGQKTANRASGTPNTNVSHQQSKSTSSRPTSAGVQLNSVGSSAIEYSLYPSGDLNEDVLNENLRRFVSDDDSDSVDDGFLSQSPSKNQTPTDQSRSLDPFSVLGNEPSQGQQAQQGPHRKVDDFHPAANSTLIGDIGNVEVDRTFEMSMPSNVSRSPASQMVKSALEMETGPTDDQRNVGTQTRGHTLANGKGQGHDDLRCKFCRRRFDSFDERQSHMDSAHQKEKKKTYKCRLCQMEFVSDSNLRKHLYIRHANGGEPMVCRTCKKEFADYTTYRAHVRTHRIGGKEITCPKCDFKFHLQPERPQPQATTSTSLVVNDLLTCDTCKFKSNYPSSFARHLKSRKHLGRVEFMKKRERRNNAIPTDTSVAPTGEQSTEKTKDQNTSMQLNRSTDMSTSLVTEMSTSVTDMSTSSVEPVSIDTGNETMDTLGDIESSDVTELGVSVLNLTKVDDILAQEEMNCQKENAEAEPPTRENVDDENVGSEAETEFELPKAVMQSIMVDLINLN